MFMLETDSDSTDIIEANPNGVVRENDAIYMFSQYNMFKYACAL